MTTSTLPSLQCVLEFNEGVYTCEVIGRHMIRPIKLNGKYDKTIDEFMIMYGKQRYDVVFKRNKIIIPYATFTKGSRMSKEWDYDIRYDPLHICHIFCRNVKTTEEPNMQEKSVIVMVIGMMLGMRKIEFKFSDQPVNGDCTYQICKSNMHRAIIPELNMPSNIVMLNNNNNDKLVELNLKNDDIPNDEILDVVKAINYVIKIKSLTDMHEIIRYFECIAKVVEITNVVKQKLVQLNVKFSIVWECVEIIDSKLRELKLCLGVIRSSSKALQSGLVEKCQKFVKILDDEIAKYSEYNVFKTLWNNHTDEYGLETVTSQIRDFVKFIKGDCVLKNGTLILNSPSEIMSSHIHQILQKTMINDIISGKSNSTDFEHKLPKFHIFIQHLVSVTDCTSPIESFDEIQMYINIPNSAKQLVFNPGKTKINYIVNRVFILQKDDLTKQYIPLTAEQYVTMIFSTTDDKTTKTTRSYTIKHFKSSLNPTIFFSCDFDTSYGFKAVYNDNKVKGFYGYILEEISCKNSVYIPKLLTLPGKIADLIHQKRESMVSGTDIMIPFLTNNTSSNNELKRSFVRLHRFFEPGVLSFDILDYVHNLEVFFDLFQVNYDKTEMKTLRLQNLINKISHDTPFNIFTHLSTFFDIQLTQEMKNTPRFRYLLSVIMYCFDDLRKAEQQLLM